MSTPPQQDEALFMPLLGTTAVPPTLVPPNTPNGLDLVCHETMPSRTTISEMETRHQKRKDSGESGGEEEECAGKKQQIFGFGDVPKKPSYEQIVPCPSENLNLEIVPETPLASQENEYVPMTPEHSPPPLPAFPRTLKEWRTAVLSTGKDAITLGMNEYYDNAMHSIQSMLGPDVDVEDYMQHLAKTGFTKDYVPPPKGCVFEDEYYKTLYKLLPDCMEGVKKDAGSKMLDFLLNTKVFHKKRFDKAQCSGISPLFKEMPMHETIRVAIFLMARIAESEADDPL